MSWGLVAAMGVACVSAVAFSAVMFAALACGDEGPVPGPSSAWLRTWQVGYIEGLKDGRCAERRGRYTSP